MLHIEGRKAEKIQRLLKYEKTGFLERGINHYLYIVIQWDAPNLHIKIFLFYR